ncbi:hypothetical protein ACIQFP_08825 [Nocardiopsis alba]|uniref:hypothetical protein n=1 Tax=Nocardiopsis alba TaxID=53437 RepID=UPI00131DC06B|nr:hypothetical protein [Nocardiopsis alba]
MKWLKSEKEPVFVSVAMVVFFTAMLSCYYIFRGVFNWTFFSWLIVWIFLLVFTIWNYSTYGRGSSDE